MNKTAVRLSIAAVAFVGLAWYVLAGRDHGDDERASHGGGMTETGSTPKGAQAPAQRFATLDDYLRFLKENSAMDLPFYRPVGPDTYEYVTGRGQKLPRPQFTRKELMDKFGFEK